MGLAAATRFLVIFFLVTTPVVIALTIVGDLDYALKGSAGIVADRDDANGIVVTEVILGTPAAHARVERGDRIIRIDDEEAASPDAVNFRAPGSTALVTLQRGRAIWSIPLAYKKLFDQFNSSIGLWILTQATALIFYFIGLVVAWRSRRRGGALVTFTCCFLALAFNGSSLATRLPALSDFPMLERYLIFGRQAPLFVAIAISLTVHFAGVFPRPKPILVHRPWVASLFYFPLPLMLAVYFAFPAAWGETVTPLVMLGIICAGVAVATGMFFHSVRTAPLAKERMQAQVLFVGLLVGLMPHIAFLFLRMIGRGSGWPLLLNLSVLIFPLSFAYVILRHRHLGVQLLLSGGAKYTLVSRGADVAFVLFGILITGRPLYLMGRDGTKTSTLVYLIVGATVVVALVSVRQWLSKRLEERFFPQVHDARRTLAELGRTAVTILDLEELLQLVVDKVKTAFRLDRAAVLIRDGDRFRVGRQVGFAASTAKGIHFPADGAVHGSLGDSPQGVRVYLGDPDCAVSRAVAEKPSELRALRRLGANLLMPLESAHGLVGFLALGPKPAEEMYTVGEMQFLSHASAQATIAIENAQLSREVASREQQRREIERARELQQSLQPDGDPEFPGVVLSGSCQPATEVAGDYYDYLRLSDDKVFVILGDVTGHGLESGIMAAVAKSALITQAGADPGITGILHAVDRAMRISKHTIFMTAVVISYDPATGVVEYGLAGHPPGLLLRAAPNGRPQPEPMTGGFYPLGIESEKPYVPQSLHVEAGDCLLLYSDGIIEARNEAGEPFGLDRLEEAFRATAGLTPDRSREAIIRSLEAFAGPSPWADDVTVVTIQFT